MKNSNGCILFLLLSLLILNSCAKRGTPEGGPVDVDPPRYVSASPENYSINFDEEEIRINFNEYIKLNEAQNQIIISPPMDPRPEITPLGTASRSVRIRINDTLEPNTTYAINFGRSIVDNNEGNPLNFFRYVFSTGSYIDSLEVGGAVRDAYQVRPDPFISVMLYEVDSTYTDSAVYNRNPRYITNTLDSAITFQLENLKEGTYEMIALRDDNNNYQFDPAREKIGFLEDYVQIPTDSLYLLTLFQEELPFTPTRPSLQGQQHVIIGYEGELVPEETSIDVVPPTPAGFTTAVTRDRETDTLHFWYRPEVERDSLQLLVNGPEYTDTLLLRIRPSDRDSLQLGFEPTGTLDFNQDLRILPNIPLSAINDSLINFLDQDTLPVSFTTRYSRFENEVILEFEKEPEQTYSFEALPGAFIDFFGTENDTLRGDFRTRAYSDYGNLILNLENVPDFPVIVQLTNEEAEPLAEQYSTEGGSFTFQNLRPGEYLLRVIYDVNANGQWDTGNFLEKRQPEEIIYYPETIEVRANWDDSYLFILD